MTKEITLTSEEIETVSALGGPTFRPMARGRLKCNQIPRLGSLTRRQVGILRSMIWAREREGSSREGSSKRPLSKTPLPEPSYPKRLERYLGRSMCPYCGGFNQCIKGQIVTCLWCYKPYIG